MELKKYRLQKNMTQAELAEVCGCDRSTIGKIESGDITPRVKLAKIIASVLDFDWTLFYKDTTKGA